MNSIRAYVNEIFESCSPTTMVAIQILAIAVALLLLIKLGSKFGKAIYYFSHT